jgi:sodium-dependent dicarboxylate transporter 2/3/5
MEVKNYSGQQLTGLLIGLGGGFLLFLFPVDTSNLLASRAAAVVFLMAAWWLTEAIPIAVTSMIPLVLFPIFGILSAKQVASAYVNNIIFLFIGAFMIAITVEKWQLHRRMSIKIIKVIGGSPARMLFAVMLSAWMLSMLINNTSTTMLMLPIAVSIILQMEEINEKTQIRGFSTAMLLGIAYGSSIGGMATIVGTPPNLVFARIFSTTFPHAPEIDFSTWMMGAFPISAIMLIVTWLVLNYILIRKKDNLKVDRQYILDENKKLGSMSYEEKIIAFLLLLLTLMWFFRADLELGSVTIPGWTSLFSFGKMIDDSTVAVFIAFLLFFIPSKSQPGKFMMDNTIFKKIPWDIIILFGGGFAIAHAFKTTGLATFISSHLTILNDVSPIVMIIAICGLLTFLTELTSNTATTQTVLPILAATAVAMHVNPLLFMIPATISASMAFMMPVATPPNAIIFGTSRIKIYEMARVGIILNFIGMVVITVLFYYLGTVVFNINPNQFPWWAAN